MGRVAWGGKGGMGREKWKDEIGRE